MSSTKKLLIISAHVDDHIISAGTVFKLQEQEGYEVYEIVMTDSSEGNDRRKGKEKKTKEGVRLLRTSEFSEASKFLGTKEKYLFNEQDLNLEFSQDLMFKTLKLIREIKPNIIFTMNENDYHKDHIAASKVAKEAAFWAATGIRPELGEPHRTDIVLYGEGMLPIQPEVLVDITGYHEKKIELFKIYESQADSKSLVFTTSLMAVRGYHLRKKKEEYAEAFNLNPVFPTILFQ